MNKLRAAKNFFAMHASWLGEGGIPVAPDHAQRRANVCLKCPMNSGDKPFYEHLAANIAGMVRNQIEYKNQLKLRVDGEKSLHVCLACLCVLKLKVHVPLAHIRETTPLDDLHPDCWILTELRNP